MRRFYDWLERRRVSRTLKRRARFRLACKRNGVPDDVAERLLHAGAYHIDWYAGRRDAAKPWKGLDA